MAVRSRRLWGPDLLSPVGDTKIVPAGHVYLIKVIIFRNAAAVPQVLAMTLFGNFPLQIIYSATVPANTNNYWDRQLILNPGDPLDGFSTLTDSAAWSAYGADLLLPS